MDLSTRYMGLALRNPIVASASPLNSVLGNIERLAEAGAGAVVLPSLFQEQIEADEARRAALVDRTAESFPEALSYFPKQAEYGVGPDTYLELIRQARDAVDIPVIASLNGISAEAWLDYARLIEEAGASALELNIYFIPADLSLSGSAVEQRYRNIVSAVSAGVKIPVAVKLSPYFSAPGNLALSLVEAGARGLVLFNRFYQPDIDLETLEVTPNILLSTPMAMRVPLRWVALLHGKLRASLAATSGIHRATDVLKMLMAGADVTMLCSALIRHGPRQLSVIERDMVAWMEEHEYGSVSQLKGSMSQRNCAEPSAFERAQYMRAISQFPGARS